MLYGSTAAVAELGFLFMVGMAESGLTVRMLSEQNHGLRLRAWAAE